MIKTENSNTPALYIHIPFCEKKCPFCSFAVVAGQAHRRDDYLEALAREASRYRGTEVDTVYIGGGTPSLLEDAQIKRLGVIVAENFHFLADCEKTFEVNPESLTPEKAATLAACGFNRISLGVQSLDDRYLEYLGRRHRADNARRAFTFLRQAGFRNISLDMMYGFPGQTAAELDRDLREILDLGSEHVSAYSLTVEERSLFFAKREKVVGNDQTDLYALVLQKLKGHGMRQYEISNFARPGFESKHNLNYWQGGDYIGMGMAAHSHRNGKRSWNADTFPQYMRLIEEKGWAVTGSENLAPGEKLVELFLFGLRMNTGVDLDSLERKIGISFAENKMDELANLIEMGFLEEDGTVIRTTDKGRLVLDEISARLI